MYDKSLESISAMMDGEIEELELRSTINSASKDQEFSDKWLRYHLAQDVMQGRAVHINKNVDLVSRVSAALEDEPSYSAKASAIIEQSDTAKASPISAANDQWWKPIASMAVAASVTAVILLGAQQYNQDSDVITAPNLAGISLENEGFAQGQFGRELATVSVSSQNAVPTTAKNGYGMERYIQLHRDLTTKKSANWQVNWLPNGYKQVAHKVSGQAEVMLYSNGKSAVSVNVEPLGSQVASQGVLGSDDLLALGMRSDRSFITVVGRVSSQTAEKIAASVSAKK